LLRDYCCEFGDPLNVVYMNTLVTIFVLLGIWKFFRIFNSRVQFQGSIPGRPSWVPGTSDLERLHII